MVLTILSAPSSLLSGDAGELHRWDSNILLPPVTFPITFLPQGVDKHAVLRSALPSIGSDLKFQRLYTEYKDQLDMAQPS